METRFDCWIDRFLCILDFIYSRCHILFSRSKLNSRTCDFMDTLDSCYRLTNGIREEILYRGIFLKKYEAFLDQRSSNLLQAIIFSLSHSVAGLGISSYTEDTAILVLTTFILGLIWGLITQKTGSVLGTVFFQARTDIAVFIGVFSNLV